MHFTCNNFIRETLERELESKEIILIGSACIFLTTDDWDFGFYVTKWQPEIL